MGNQPRQKLVGKEFYPLPQIRIFTNENLCAILCVRHKSIEPTLAWVFAIWQKRMLFFLR